MRVLPLFVSLLAFVLILTTSPAHACLWDDDTLREEMKGKDRVVEAITGYYDVYPPRYYEMRLERVTRELERDPSRLGDYDNAGVACDRLGRTEEAIAWMARKRDALDKLAPSDPSRSDHEYRYLSNLGTFHLHRWVQNGMDRARMEDIETAISLIGKAIEENPDAHFGREVYQLKALEWILRPPPRHGDDPGMITMAGLEPDYEAAANGFAGLITLGTGEDLLDVWFALGASLVRREDRFLGYFVTQRVTEKIKGGAKTLHPQFQNIDMLDVAQDILPGGAPREHERTAVDRWFLDARTAAAKRREVQWAYLDQMFSRGEHPDTHPDVWAKAPQGLPLPRAPLLLKTLITRYWLDYWRYLIVGLPLLVILITSTIRAWRKRAPLLALRIP